MNYDVRDGANISLHFHVGNNDAKLDELLKLARADRADIQVALADLGQIADQIATIPAASQIADRVRAATAKIAMIAPSVAASAT